METKKEIIDHIDKHLKNVPDGQIIKLPNEHILKVFFEKVKLRNGTYKYIQREIELFFENIDMSDFIKDYSHHINMLVGANCESGNLKFNDAYYVFLNPQAFTAVSLNNINAIEKLEIIPDTNLANNDFRYCGDGWDLADFLYVVRKNIEPYIYSKYSSEYRKIYEVEDLDFTQTYVDDSYVENLQNRYLQDLKKLIKKLIPNLQNTGIRISFHPSFSTPIDDIDYEIICEVLESRKFDGCYVSAEIRDKNGQIEHVFSDKKLFYFDDTLKPKTKK